MKTLKTLIPLMVLAVSALMLSACDKDSQPITGPTPPKALAPAAPTGLVASNASSSSTLLQWQNNADNESGFTVERSLSATGGFVAAASVGAGVTSTSMTNLSPATKYYFRVCAHNSAGNSGYSNTATATTLDNPTSPPAAPSNLQATNPTTSSIRLSWQNNADNEDGFSVEQSLSATTNFTVVSSVAAGITNTVIPSLSPGTRYYFRVRATNSAGNSGYSNTANATTFSDVASAPALTGPATVTNGQHFRLEWTYDWAPCTHCPSTDGYRLEESSTSAASGFSTIWDSYLTGDRQSPKALVITPRAAGTYWYRVRAFDGGWSDYSNVVRVEVQEIVSRTRFVNNTSYIIVSLVINGYEQFPTSPLGIVPGGYYELELAPGTYTVTAANGFWDGRSRFSMYTWAGNFTQQAGATGEVTFSDPSIQQLLARFTSSAYWEGNFYHDGLPHVAGFRFFSNSNWDLYLDGTKLSSGRYSLVSRNPSAFTVTFTVGDHQGTLYETFGYFTMRNGPADFSLIQYFPTGGAAAAQSGPVEVPMNVTIHGSVD